MPLWISRQPATKRFAHALPIVYEGQAVPGALFLAGFGVLFGGAPLILGLLGLIKNDSRIPLALGLAPFVLFGGGCAWLGLKFASRRESFVITASSVSYALKDISGSTRWDQPLSAYRGVVAQEDEVRRRAGSDIDSPGPDSYTEYRVILKHATDRGKDIELFNDRTGADLEAEVEGLSKLLGVPVLREKPEGGFEARAAGDLDESLAQRASEGKVPVPASADRPLPGGKLRRERGPEGEFLIGPLGGPAALVAGIVMLLLGAVLLTKPVSSFLGIISLALGAVFSLFGLGEEALCLTADGLRQEYRLWRNTLRGTSLAKSDVNDIFLFQPKGSSREVVRVTSKSAKIDAGQSISADERRWLKDYLLARLVRS